MEFFAPLAMPSAWAMLVTLLFLELVLGVDNLVFIAVTTDRLPPNKQRVGRRIGLMAALVMRIAFLCVASEIVGLKGTIIQLPITVPGMEFALSGRDLILLFGGAYLIFKGIQEVAVKLSLREEQGSPASQNSPKLRIGLVQATATIAVMDIVFSIDSVITAVGLAEDMLIVMILAVMIAVLAMMVFADPLSKFVNSNPEVKILALVFIVAVGVKLVTEAFGVEIRVADSAVEVIDVVLYSAMAFSLLITTLQMLYNARRRKLHANTHTDKSENQDR
jgi:predicted tellurium resistance membrane protein TerC